MNLNRTVSCIIPAHNEEKSISATLQAVLGAGDILKEIIVIDDGSTDKTKEIVKEFKNIRFLINEKNLGKSGTVASGIKESTGDYVMFLDADLMGLNSSNIISLITPILRDEADVVISMRTNTPVWMRWFGFDSMSGERIFPKGVLDQNLQAISNLRSYGLEVFTNRLIINNRLRVKTVKLDNITNPTKWGKKSFWQGIKGELLMWRDLFKTVSFFEFVGQHIKIRRLLIK